MLYVLVGEDSYRAKERARELTKDAEVVRFGEGGEPVTAIFEYLGARGMFSSAIALIAEDALAESVVLENISALVEADASICLIERSLTADVRKRIPKKATIETFDIERPDTVPANVFALADAFASGDRKTTWITYRTLIESGSSGEELHGIVSWQSRAIVLASKTKTAAEAGLKPFVFTKAKRSPYASDPMLAEKISRELVSVYHQARRGEGSLEDLLEAFLLKKSTK